MSESIIKLLLQVGIQALGKIIPALGGFLGGPLGFLATLAISWLSGLLFDWIEKLRKFGAVDKRYLDIANGVKAANDAYIAVVDKPDSTSEQKAKAYDDFKAAIRKIKYGAATPK